MQDLLHVIDFEGNLKYGVVEWGVVSILGDGISALASGLCRPKAPVSPRDILVHGLKDEMLASCPPFSEEEGRFRDLRRTGLFAAHHAPVERNQIMDYWPLPPFPSRNPPGVTPTSDWGPWVDSRNVAARVFPVLPEYGLSSLIVSLDLIGELKEMAHIHCTAGRDHSHCALYDACASALVLLRCMKVTGWRLQDLVEASAPSCRKPNQGLLF